MQKIIPHLWFDKEAREAAGFYSSLFPDSRITNVTTLHDTPSGDCDVVSFELWKYSFMAISAGPLFRFNPSISLMVNFDPSRDREAGKRIDAVWGKLAEGGKVLMPLDKYPFSDRYGWIEDKYGLSWQLILSNPAGEARPPIVPSLLFAGNVCGKAEDATGYYLSVFSESKRGRTVRYGTGQAPEREGTIMFTDFVLRDQWFAAMDSALAHDFAFNEALSLLVECDNQAEIDYYWEKLSAVPQSEQCGWLKDTYGVVWQIVPAAMAQMMRTGTRQQIDRLTQTFLPMKKLDLEKLKKAFDGK
jgi:predicted 3-demethylubiquinone-9 3-methyltransferase (glyoxalase superfamily)